jgi:hypothetical protein
MDIELIGVMIIRDDDDGIRTARAFATRDAAIRAILIAAEKESDPATMSAAVVKWDKTLGTVNADLSLQTEWDSDAVIELVPSGSGISRRSPPG